MRIITFYNNRFYKDLAIKLVASGKSFGYNIQTRNIEIARWERMIAAKADVLLEEYTHAHKTGNPLLYLDADIIIQKPISELFKIIAANDLSVRERHDGNSERFNLGVMGFGLRQHGSIKKLLSSWSHKLKNLTTYTQSVDQQPFAALLGLFPELKVRDIGYVYNMLPSDLATKSQYDAAIWHYKASRVENNELAREWRKLFANKGTNQK